MLNQTSHIKRQRRTKEERDTLLQTAITILEEDKPMTVRQVYYQLVSLQLIDNNRSQYQAVSNLLVEARKAGLVPWEWVEDRLRRPREISMWDDLSGFIQTVRGSYRRDVWNTQHHYIEVWLEKDALSGIFEGVLRPYGITLNVGRGYDGWDSIHNAAERYSYFDEATILYFGDFDPSGEDMVRSLAERLGFFGCSPDIVKCALTLDDIRRYNLPPDFTKKTDSRRAAFVDRWGDVSVELDALPRAVLQTRIVDEIEQRIDLQTLQETKKTETEEIGRLNTLLDNAA